MSLKKRPAQPDIPEPVPADPAADAGSASEAAPARRTVADAVMGGIEKVTLAGAVLGLAVIVFAVVFQVIARYVTTTSTAWTPDLATIGFVWAALLAIPLGVRSERHMLVDIWRKMGKGVQTFFYVVSSVAIIAVAGTLVWYGIAMLPISFRRDMPGLGISTGWMMLAVPVGFGLSALFQVELLIRRFTHHQVHTAVEEDAVAAIQKEA